GRASPVGLRSEVPIRGLCPRERDKERRLTRRAKPNGNLRCGPRGSRRTQLRSPPKPTRRLLEQGAPQRGVDEPRSAAASRTGERRPPGWVRKGGGRRRGGGAWTPPEAATSGEIVDRPRDARET